MKVLFSGLDESGNFPSVMARTLSNVMVSDRLYLCTSAKGMITS